MAAKTATKATASLATMLLMTLRVIVILRRLKRAHQSINQVLGSGIILGAFFLLWVSLVSLVDFNDVEASSFGVDVPELES